MPFWDGPFTMLPAFEGVADDGTTFRTSDRRQFRHLAVVFAHEPAWALTQLAEIYDEVQESGGDLVIVAPPDVEMNLPIGVPVVRDEGGAIEARYQPILEEWHHPVTFVADRYGEITAITDGRDPEMAEHVAQWVFSNEVQCAL